MSNTAATLLIVDDDVHVRELLEALLQEQGYHTLTASSGEQALSTVAQQQPDLILLDAMMPKISGFDVLDILRNTPETANVRIIMLTALSQPKDRERAEGLGVDEYMVKSQVVIGDVVARVKHHLGLDN